MPGASIEVIFPAVPQKENRFQTLLTQGLSVLGMSWILSLSAELVPCHGLMTSRVQETKVSCWSMPPELSEVPVAVMRLKTIQIGMQVPLGSEFEMG